VIGCWVTSIYPRPGSPGKVPTTFFRPGPVRRLPRARLVTPEYHFVWVTKYRYHMLRGDVGERVRELVSKCS